MQYYWLLIIINAIDYIVIIYMYNNYDSLSYSFTLIINVLRR